MKNLHYDIIVIGSGIVGSTAALALAKNTNLKIAVIDLYPSTSYEKTEDYDHRVSAISLASKSIFEKINVWEKIIAKRYSDYTHMHVWEETNHCKIDFDCKDISENALGYIVEDNVMRGSLHETIKSHNQIDLHCPVKLISLRNTTNQIELISENNNFTASLLIAADGAHSWVREQAGLELKIQSYDHTAIVATVHTEFSHQSTAWQQFLTHGPLAFLPLSDPHHASIVWSTDPLHATQLLALDDDEFRRELSAVFADKLGLITQVSKRYHFPLTKRHVKNYVQSRMALIGDAAHTIHPLAGQGMNLGLLDAAALAEVISTAAKKQRDYASLPTLRRYERWRKSDNLAMLVMIDVIKYLFMSNKETVQTVRNLGLNFTDRSSFLKNFFVNYAVGNRSNLPELAK